MTSDLLFSILPREGKVPIDHDYQKVKKIDKQEALKTLSDEEQELHLEEREARQQQQEKQKEKEHDAEQLVTDNQLADDKKEDSKQKKPKGPKHLDVYV